MPVLSRAGAGAATASGGLAVIDHVDVTPPRPLGVDVLVRVEEVLLAPAFTLKRTMLKAVMGGSPFAE